jgi:hypothetical protein
MDSQGIDWISTASGAFANGRSLPFAVLTRRLYPHLGAPYRLPSRTRIYKPQ